MTIVISAQQPHLNIDPATLSSNSLCGFRNQNVLDPPIVRAAMVFRIVMPGSLGELAGGDGQTLSDLGEVRLIAVPCQRVLDAAVIRLDQYLHLQSSLRTPCP